VRWDERERRQLSAAVDQIIAVHLAGTPCDLDALKAIADGTDSC
jgi:dTDP-4-amino-4,6-dideoxygalactose transaminase